MSALFHVQQALYQALTADTALMAKISGVFDHQSADQPFPYVVIGESSEGPLNTFEQNGMEVEVTVRIYSSTQGYAEAFDILSTLHHTLKTTELQMEQFETISAQYLSGETVVEENSPLKHVQAVYRIIVQRNNAITN